MSRNRYLILALVAVAFTLSACDASQPSPTKGEPGLQATVTPVDPIVNIASPSDEAATPTAELDSTTESPTPAETASTAPGEEEASQAYAGTVPAPDFPIGLDWLNTSRPLTMADLRGKIVLLDFWTYGCINCMHIIPELEMLEEKYADELVVIGVHSAKFENEADSDNIRSIILRYELKHPVVNDRQFQIWSQYGARAWPTLVLIDPQGNVLGYHSGEGIFEPFDFVIGNVVEEFDSLGLIDRTPLELRLEGDRQVDSPLLFPGKVLADGENDRLFIADSNHNRIVIADLDGNVLEVIGDGQSGLQDGDYETASFFRPQGLALDGENNLYVADTENHAIRKVDLAERLVETIAGTGQQVYMGFSEADALSTPLNSPWDVLFHEGLLYVAMAGQHQLWVLESDTGTISVHAGSGREELKDGALNEGGLNQPSGLATDGRVLYFADSEASAIRTADIDPDGQLETIVGTGLFDFGDLDGVGDEALLQHPLGIDYHDGLLYVADTYNSKIKAVNPETQESTTLLGGEESGWRDGSSALFDEPGGLSYGDGLLYIADTNNHVVRVADTDSGEVSTLVLIDMDGLLTRQPAGVDYNGAIVRLDQQTVSAGDGEISLEIVFPDGYKANDLAPFSMDWTTHGEALIIEEELASRRIIEPVFPLTFTADFRHGQGELEGDLVIYFCEEESQSLCSIERVRITAPFVVVDEGADSLIMLHAIEAPAVDQIS